nr:LHBs [Domestic donkey hepatitis B virus]QMV34926.1 surface proteins [Equine hepatitis B virus]QMV34662.1 LHBs [Domestic donkey hepatitis B virus]QMV34666.1 LHBs [Domestic donkey hepatitis B virus]QMV34930.1 surface proteins [Equine hepatitis B virus]
MGQNQSVPNPLGFLPVHSIDTSGGGGWDHSIQKDPWPQAKLPSPGNWGPGFTPPHTWNTSLGRGALTSGAAGPRRKGRRPTPLTPPSRQTHPHLFPTKTPQLIVSGEHLTTLHPVVPTASSTSSTYMLTGGLVPKMSEAGMGSMFSGLLGPLVGLQVVSFLWTKILTIAQSLDWWWTSLSFPGGIPKCLGQNLPYPTCDHSPTSCPVTCTGYRWMCLRRFIIYLLVLVLCLFFLLVALDWKGYLPVCPFPPGPETSGSTTSCKACTQSALEDAWPPYCCCTKPSDSNCTCWPIPSSWAFGRFLWGLASVRFSWLSSLLPLLQWFAGISPTVWLLLIWMIWFWGPGLLSILSPFIPLFAIFFYLWAYI